MWLEKIHCLVLHGLNKISTDPSAPQFFQLLFMGLQWKNTGTRGKNAKLTSSKCITKAVGSKCEIDIRNLRPQNRCSSLRLICVQIRTNCKIVTPYSSKIVMFLYNDRNTIQFIIQLLLGILADGLFWRFKVDQSESFFVYSDKRAQNTSSYWSFHILNLKKT